MGVLGDRISGWVEDRRKAWGNALGKFLLDRIAAGINATVAEIEPGTSLSVEAVLHRIRDDPNTPTELRDLIDKATAPGHPLPMLLMLPLALLFLVPTVTAIFRPLGNLWEYKQERVLKTARFDPISVITAWRRDPQKYAGLFSDLKDQGWSDDSIEALKFVTLFYPGPQDLVTWLAREVFEPDMIERYGLDDEAPLAQVGLFEKAGVSQEQMLNYWRAHWEHASFMQVVEMLHRGLLTLDKEVPEPPTTPEGWAKRDEEGQKALFEWYRLVEIPPFWRDRLTAMSWNVPTRVDVRRWWDMRTIPEQELYNIYHRQGYRGKDLDNYVLWTKVYTEFPSLMARWQKGWLTEADVRSELTRLGMPADRVETMLQEKIKPEEAARVEEGKALTKTEIYKGVKKGLITADEGVELLMDLNYNRAEAEYLLSINVETLAGSPESFAEFKDLTTKWRIAMGAAAAPVPERLKQAGARVVELNGQVETLRNQVKAEESQLIPDQELPPEATARLEELRLKRNRAVAELEAARANYNGLLAEYRQTPPGGAAGA